MAQRFLYRRKQEQTEGTEFVDGGGSKCERFAIDLRRRRFILQPRVGRFGDLPWVRSDLGDLP